MSTAAETVEIPVVGPDVDYTRIANSRGFSALRKRFLGFVVPMTVAYIAWYLLFVLVAMYAPGIMAIKVTGDLTLGLVMGGLQFLSTFALATWYVRFATHTLDPAAAAIRDAVRAEQPVEPHRAGEPSTPGPDPRGLHRPGVSNRVWELRDGGVAPTRDRISGGTA